jgi:hypothetical protein
MRDALRCPRKGTLKTAASGAARISSAAGLWRRKDDRVLASEMAALFSASEDKSAGICAIWSRARRIPAAQLRERRRQ